MWTAQEGDDSLTKQLIRQGVNISYRNLHGHDTALHFAAHVAHNGRLEVVQILLNNGAEINQEDNQHRTPLIVSVEAKKYDLMLYLPEVHILEEISVERLSRMLSPIST
jgi:ankyrin repeat protein